MPTGVYERKSFHKEINSKSQVGKKLSEETKKRISDKLKGRKRNQETIEKIRKANTGKKLSEKTKKKLSDFNKGKILSEETKKKIGIASISNNGGWKKGMRHSKETRKKMSEAQRGEKGSNWKGGLSLVKEKIRRCGKYLEWRTKVFERDNYTCQQCDNRGGLLNADHIKPFSVILISNNIITLEEAEKCKELWNIENGKTLCEDCHKKTPTFGGSKK